jgi:CHAD domain-containing protein
MYMEKENQLCSICDRSVSLLYVHEKWICHECLQTACEKLMIPWKTSLELLLKNYTDACIRCITEEDPEAIHLARVIGRKIRAIFEFLGVPKMHELLLVIKKMHHSFNKVREADVLLEEMKKDCETNKVYEEIVKLVTKKRRKLQNAIEKEIPSLINESFIKNAQIFINQELITYISPLDIEKVIGKYEEHFLRQVEAYEQTVKENGKFTANSIKALHSVRIQSKSMRYMYHFLNETLGEDYQDKEAYYESIQNQFGDITDVQDWLFQVKTYERKIHATKNEIEHVKKNLKARLHHLIEKVDLTQLR